MSETSIKSIDQAGLALANTLLGGGDQSAPKIPLVKLYQPDLGGFRKDGDKLPLGSFYVSVRNPETGKNDLKEEIPRPLIGQILSKTAYLSDSKDKGDIQFFTNEIINFTKEEVILTKKSKVDNKWTYEEIMRGSYKQVKEHMKTALYLDPSYIQNIYFYIEASSKVVKIQSKPLSTSAVIDYFDKFNYNNPVSFTKTEIDTENCKGDYSQYFMLKFTDKGRLNTNEALERLKEFASTMEMIKQMKGKQYTEDDMSALSQINKQLASVNNEEINVEDIPF